MTLVTEKNQKWWILFTMTCAISMIFIDVSIVPVAIPTIQRHLQLTELGIQWIINAYILTITLFVLAFGRLGDRVGHRTVFCWGLLVFSLGSISSSISFSQGWLIGSRVLQGLGAGMLIPNAGTVVFLSFPAYQRGKAMGLYVSIGAIFLTIGPLLGGVLSQYASWRLIFWVNIPIALIGFTLARLVVPKDPGKKSSFDWRGFLFTSLGIALIIVSLMQAKNWGWSSPLTLILLALGLVLIIILVTKNRSVEEPYIDINLFKKRNFSGAILAVFCTQFFLIVTVFWAMYFQNVLGFTPTEAGVLTLLSAAPIIIVAPIGGHLLDKFGPRLPITIGFLLVASGLFWFLQNLETENVGIILSAIIPFGCGIPLIFTPSFTTAMNEVPPYKRGTASGMATMCRQFGGTLGLATMGSVFLTIQQRELALVLKKNTATEMLTPKAFEGLLAKTPKALATLDTLAPENQHFVEQASRFSYIDGFAAINVQAMIAALIGLTFFLILVRKKAPRAK